MGRCGAIWVQLHPTLPELDRLERCVSVDCSEHPVQLEWINSDERLRALYAAQVEAADQPAPEIPQGALL